jgi:hypothetical protein
VYSFPQQLAHYLDRPHTGVPTAPLQGPWAWRGTELKDASIWSTALDPAQVAELKAAVEAARGTRRPVRELRAEDFPLPHLAQAIAAWRRELADGRGFVRVRGLPVAEWSREEAETAFWGLGLHLGVPGAQNEHGDLLGHVTDLSAQAEHADERLYRTNQSIRFHCDTADVVGLLCLSTSQDGGASRLVSSVTVLNHLLETHPDLARRLFEPMLLDARQPASSPIQYGPVRPCAFDGERLRTFMHQDYYRSVERHEGVRLDPRARGALDAWEAYAETEGVHLDMQLQPGDVQLVCNHTVVHARTAYVDDPASPRHLLRLWLSLARP